MLAPASRSPTAAPRCAAGRRPGPPTPRRRARRTSADALAGPLHTPTGAMPGPADAAGAPTAATPTPPAGRRRRAPGRRPAGQLRQPGRCHPAVGTAAHRRPRSASAAPPAAATAAAPRHRPALAALARRCRPRRAGRSAPPASARARSRARRGKVQLAAAGGLAVVLLLSVRGAAPAATTPAEQPDGAADPSARRRRLAMQEHATRAASWSTCRRAGQKATGGSFIDFIDPADSGRRSRINIEKAASTADQLRARWPRTACKTRRASCAEPYNRVALRDARPSWPASRRPNSSTPAARATQTRHGIWRVVVQDGKAYHVLPDRAGRPVRARASRSSTRWSARSSSPATAEPEVNRQR